MSDLFQNIGGKIVPSIEFSPKKLRRNSDPSTSNAAAHQCGELRSHHHKLIYDALQRIGNGTIYDISFATGLGENAVARRMKEMETENFVEVIGERLAPTNRKCRVWAIK